MRKRLSWPRKGKGTGKGKTMSLLRKRDPVEKEGNREERASRR